MIQEKMYICGLEKKLVNHFKIVWVAAIKFNAMIEDCDEYAITSITLVFVALEKFFQDGWISKVK